MYIEIFELVPFEIAYFSTVQCINKFHLLNIDHFRYKLDGS